MVAGVGFAGYACGSEDSAVSPSPKGGTLTAVGGSSPGTGGNTASGGALASSGGSTGAGASAPVSAAGSGGVRAPATGGVTATGGTVATGGVTAAGGASATGGVSAGGQPSNGGQPAAAGSAGQAGAAGGPAAGSPYNPDFKEFVGEDCTVGEPKTVNSETLPDPFLKYDGTRMTKKSEWACQRAEIKKAVETYIHGVKPGRPEKVTGEVTATSIKVRVEHMGKSIDFSVSVSIPAGAKQPAPAIIGLGGGSLSAALLREEGVAAISYNNSDLANETSRSGKFSTIYGNTGASAQVGWAWGVSRIIDVLVDEQKAGRNNFIDPTAIGVTGCSRLGKGAFTIGAFDERIALGIPHESGTGGVSAFRIVNTNPSGPNGKTAQSLSSAWTEAQGWFGTAFGEYRTKVNTIPVDTHSLVAMYAPRGLLVLDNSRIGELGASAQHAATVAGGQVHKALGFEKNAAYHGGRPSDPHNHCSFYSEQAEPLRRAIRAHLTRTAEPDGRMEPQPAGTADLEKWITWETPTLE